MKRKIFFIGIPCLFLVILGIYTALQLRFPTASPFSDIGYFREALTNKHATMQKDVIGFLPYWRLMDTEYIHYPLISEVDYFSLTADGKGNIVKVINNQTDPGWLSWNSTAVKNLIAHTQITGNKFTFTLAMQKNKDIENLLNNKSVQSNLIQQIAQQISSTHLDGVNLDIEYLGQPDSGLKNAFTDFAKTYSTTLKKQFPKIELSLDFMPTGGRDKGLFDFHKLAPLFDRFIVMSYDYYGAGSDVAGPVAPMKGFAEGKYFFDVTTTYADYEKVLPKGKIVMGVPYYGWDYSVKNGQKILTPILEQNDANGYTALLSYGRMKQDADLKPNQCFWDSLAASPWCWYKDKITGKDHQVWFENEQSIRTKFAYATNQNFAGVALWTLGFDKQYEDLWNLIHTSFTTQ